METIEVRYAYIPGLDVFHKYIVYTNLNGQEFSAEAEPTNRDQNTDTLQSLINAESNLENLFGPIKAEFHDDIIDYNHGEIIQTGSDLSSIWNNIKQEMQNIGNGNTFYKPLTQNSNWSVDEVLKRTGLPQPYYDNLPDGYLSPGSQELYELLEKIKNIVNQYRQIINERINDLFNSAQLALPVRRDPLILDLDGDGLETTGFNAANPIYFDHDANGVKEGTGWVKPDDGFLVLDRNGNGLIDDGTELFGDHTPLTGGGNAVDGFAALAQEDTNLDGQVDAGDAHFADLKVWRDLNQDGISQAGELFTLAGLNIAAINVAQTAHSQLLANGNQIADLGNYTRVDGSVSTIGEASQLADINLIADTFHRQFATTIPPTAETAALPDMHGSGAVRDLREAATQSSAVATLLGQYAAATTRAGQLALIDPLLAAWADTSGYAATLNDRAGSSYIVHNSFASWDQLVHVLEAFNGRYFFSLPNEPQTGGGAVNGLSFSNAGANGVILGTLTINYNSNQLNLFNQSYEALRESVYSALLSQTRFKPLLDSISLSINTNGISLDFSAMQQILQAHIDSDPVSGISDLIEFTRYTQTLSPEINWDGWSMLENIVRNTTATPELLATYKALGLTKIEGNGGFGSQADILLGGNASNTLWGGGSNDVLFGGDGNDILYGGTGNDLFYGESGNDILQGDTGSDVYIVNLGDGQDVIVENNTSTADMDSLRFGAGIAPGDISWMRNGYNLVLNVKNTTDQVTVQNFGGGIEYRIEQINFSDGTRWDVAYLYAPLAGVPIIGGDNGDLLVAWWDENAILQGMGGNDTLHGNNGNDTLEGGIGADTLIGGTGNDAYLFNPGDGQDWITEDDGIDTLRFGTGIAPENITLMRSGYDLVVAINGTTDQLTVQNFGLGDSYKIEQVAFADGTVWDTTALPPLITSAPTLGGNTNDTLTAWLGYDSTLLGLEGNDILFGNIGNDTLDGGIGTDTLVGGTGNDVYLFNLGDGQDWITEDDGIDTLRFGTGITPENITLIRSGYDLVVAINGTTDQLTVQNFGLGDSYKIEQVAFADGTVWDTTALTPLITSAPTLGGSTDDTLNAWPSYGSMFIGMAGNDTLLGGTGDDVYLFNLGDGQDQIIEDDGIDTLRFGTSIAPGGIRLMRSGYDLIVAINGTNDQLTVQNFGLDGNHKIEQVAFANGTVWDTAILNGLIASAPTLGGNTDDTLTAWLGYDSTLIGMAGNDWLYGNIGNDTLDGGTGTDTLLAGTGDDVYLFNLGDGQDVIIEDDSTPANIDSLRFGTGIAPGDIRLMRSGYDLVLTINGTTDQLTVQNFGLGDSYKIEQVVFADGTVWDTTQLKSLVAETQTLGSNANDTLNAWSGYSNTLLGLEGDDWLYGSTGNDTLNGGTGADTLIGDAGNDVYQFNLGDGQDSIYDSDYNLANVDTIQFGIGIAPGDISLARSGYDLVLALRNSTDQLTLKGFGYGNSNHIEQASFVDGTVWDLGAQIVGLPFVGNNSYDSLRAWYDYDCTLQGLAGNDLLIGANGNDTLDGGLGNDTMRGLTGNDYYFADAVGDKVTEAYGAGIDTIERNYDTLYVLESNVENLVLAGTVYQGNGNDLDNVITGNDAANSLLGLNGNDTLIGGSGDDSLFGDYGQDRMLGGTGNDNYEIDNVADTVIEDANAGDDFVRSSVSFTLGDNLERLEIDGTALSATGNALDNGLWGNAGNNSLAGLAGNDYLMGAAGDDSYLFNRGDGQDYIDNTDLLAATDTLQFGDGIADTDVLAFRSGNNLYLTIKGGTDRVGFSNYYGADVANGNEVSDHKIDRVEFANGVVWDQAALQVQVDRATNNHSPVINHFLPTLQGRAGSFFSYTVPADTITDPDPWDSVTYSAKLPDGSALPAWLSFDPASRTLSGTPGIGQVGSFQFILRGTDNYNYSMGEYVTFNIAAPNRAPMLSTPLADQSAPQGAAFSYTLPTTAFTDPDAGDTLSYSATLADGSTLPVWLAFNAATRLFSGTPSVLGTTSIRVTAVDTSGLSVSDVFDIVVSVQNLTLNGTSAADTLTGGLGNDTLNGQGGNDTLVGNAGNDVLNGGTGNDVMQGGIGDDSYIVDSGTDSITENLNEGLDSVQSSVSYVLANQVENLLLTGTTAINGTGNAQDNVLTGNSAANTLTGGAGNDRLDGKAGADKMLGGLGDDVYVVDKSTDAITEKANEGTDSVESGITLTLAANLENLLLTGSTAINGTGNTLNNTLTGNSAANSLGGAAGNDILDGKGGADTLTGGLGNDVYLLGRGYGNDTLIDNDSTVGNSDTVQFLTGISANQIWFSRPATSNNLKLDIIGTADSVTIKDWYLGTANHAEQFKTVDGTRLLVDGNVQNLVNAMAAFTPPPLGQTTLPDNYLTVLAPIIDNNWLVY